MPLSCAGQGRKRATASAYLGASAVIARPRAVTVRFLNEFGLAALCEKFAVRAKRFKRPLPSDIDMLSDQGLGVNGWIATPGGSSASSPTGTCVSSRTWARPSRT